MLAMRIMKFATSKRFEARITNIVAGFCAYLMADYQIEMIEGLFLLNTMLRRVIGCVMHIYRHLSFSLHALLSSGSFFICSEDLNRILLLHDGYKFLNICE